MSHEVEQPGQMAQAYEHLLSAREAALVLDVNARTAPLRARCAPMSGDRVVQTIAGANCAPGWW